MHSLISGFNNNFSRALTYLSVRFGFYSVACLVVSSLTSQVNLAAGVLRVERFPFRTINNSNYIPVMVFDILCMHSNE